MMNPQEIAEILNKVFDIEDSEPKELTKEQKSILEKRFTHNIRTFGVMLDKENDLLIFTNKNAYKNWLYYAGLEYIEEVPSQLVKDGEFILFYSRYDHDRIETIIDLLEEVTEENNEN